MASGNNHAKQIVLDEAKELAEQLQDGGSGDAHVQGRAIGLLVKMITPLYSAEFVTIDECRMQHDIIGKVNRPHTKLKVGPVEFEGMIPAAIVPVVTILAVFGCMFYAMGKVAGWW